MQSLALVAASLLSPFFVEVTPEVRSSYVSIGKLMEDRPMQITNVRAGYDAGDFGRFGIRNWDVSSLTEIIIYGYNSRKNLQVGHTMC